MDWSNLPFDVRGPWGIAGVGLIAGSAALLAAGIGGGDPAPDSDPVTTGLAMVRPFTDDPALVTPNGSPASGAAPVWDNGPAPEDQPVIDPEPAPLTPEREERPSSPLVTTQQASGGVMPARAGTSEVVFIVRLRGAPEVDVITRNFRRDPAAAQTAWSELVARIPELAEFELSSASYSGEIRLLYRMPSATPAAVRAVQERLLAIDGVSYVDPDYVAHPGQEETP